MNETVKLIIEIPKDYYEIIKHDIEHHLTDYRPFEIIGNGRPLDDIKAEIVEEIEDVGNGAYSDGLYKALEIINKHIGKGDEE